jgi:hypothetical protein
MKFIILPLLIASISIAEARVYKCLDKASGRYTYQEKACTQDRKDAEKDQVNIVPTNQKKVHAAVEKLKTDLKIHQAKKAKVAEAAKAKANDKTQTQINVTLPTTEAVKSPKNDTHNPDENQISPSTVNSGES